MYACAYISNVQKPLEWRPLRDNDVSSNGEMTWFKTRWRC